MRAILQTPTPTPDVPEADLIPRLLGEAGVPYAAVVGAAITFLATFILLYLVGRVVVLPIVNRVLRRRKLDEHVRRPLRRLTMGIVVFIAVAVAFALAGFGNLLTSLAAVAAAATLAVGFAMQDVIKNFVAGVFIYTDEPFRTGDWIEWGEFSGTVEDISFRVTRVRTFDNELLTVPNAKLTENVIKNPVAKDSLRLQVTFGIGYDDDIERASEIIVDEAEAHPELLDDPAPSVRLTELGDSSVGLTARIWIGDPSRSDSVRIRGEYVAAVKARFDEAGIDIPYPNRTLSGQVTVRGDDVDDAPADEG